MRAMMLFFAVLFAALAFGSWVVLSPQAALLLAWPALALAVLSIPPQRSRSRRIRMCWTCCDSCHAEHSNKVTAWLHWQWLRVTGRLVARGRLVE